VAQRKQTPWVWLIVAALLLVAGAWLMRGAEPPEPPPPPPVRLPTRMSGSERIRADNRRVWVPPAVEDAGVAVPPQRPQDPVLALIPSEVKRGAVVAEFNAIMNSELGGLMADCFFAEGAFLNDLRDAGLDPVKQVDRVAMIEDSLVVTGDFKNAGWKKFLPENAVSKGYGRSGELIEVARPDGGTDSFATWGGQMFVAGGSEAELKTILERLEGGGPRQGKPAVDDSMAYGEVYGVVAADALAELLGQEDPKLAEALRQSAKILQLHMDISHDVGLVADVKGDDPQKTEELRRTIGSALSLARMQAQAKGKTDQADLLDLARVESAEGGTDFRLQAGVPHEFMKKALEQCAERRKARRDPPSPP
jgi:hypothetical protein